MKATRSALAAGVLLSGAIVVPAAAADKVFEEHRRHTVEVMMDNPCTPAFDAISGAYEVNTHTKFWLHPDGSGRVHSWGTANFRGVDSDGVSYTGTNGAFKSQETFDATTGAYTEKDGSVLRLISQGGTPNFSARLTIHRSWSPDKGFQEHVVQDSVTCQP